MSITEPLRRRTTGAATFGALAILALATACDVDPPLPPPVFHVQTTSDLPDADPGDGICEATSGSGDCTVRAGIEEANALGAADLLLAPAEPDGYELLAAIEVTGTIRIEADATTHPWERTSVSSDAQPFADPLVHVRPGASLTVVDLGLVGVQVLVDGRFAAVRSEMFAWGERPGANYQAAITVEAEGVALVQSSWVTGYAGDAVSNRGTIMIDQSTIGAIYEFPTPTSPEGAIDLGGLDAAPGARTHLRGTWIASGRCSGTAPTSMGYNAAVGTTCGLTNPTDQQDVAPMSNHSGSLEDPTGTLLDAIPVGEAGCGIVLTDIDGEPRPRDGNGDTIAACDIGAREA